MSLALALMAMASQWPQDARDVSAWHWTRVADDPVSAPRAEEWRERLFVYQAAGAEAEAWAAAAALERLAPADADGERYAVQLSVWDPARWEPGLDLADDWLARHAERSEAERDGVARARAVLVNRVEARRAVRARQSARAWVPYAALVLGAALATFALRRPR
ncbi:MAG: hypothetical protein O3A20_05065 [Planctomycetota bacterium]|nr:hypothetical protein [Planctomycetota bacterium]